APGPVELVGVEERCLTVTDLGVAALEDAAIIRTHQRQSPLLVVAIEDELRLGGRRVHAGEDAPARREMLAVVARHPPDHVAAVVVTAGIEAFARLSEVLVAANDVTPPRDVHAVAERRLVDGLLQRAPGVPAVVRLAAHRPAVSEEV